VSTTEAHRSGWPHVNWLIHHPEFAEWLDNERADRIREGLSEREAILASREFLDVVLRSGFGLQTTAERARSAETVASYIVKLSGETDGTIGEVTKLCQLPVNAPLRFRRLRSGVGFLPPRRGSDETCSQLVDRLRFWVDSTRAAHSVSSRVEDVLASFRFEWSDSPILEWNVNATNPELLRAIVKEHKAELQNGQTGNLTALNLSGAPISFLTVGLRLSQTTGTLVRRTRHEGIPIVLALHQLPSGEEEQAYQAIATEGTQWENEEVARAEYLRRGRKKQAAAVGLPPVSHWLRGKRIERSQHHENRTNTGYD
jgi:hypothetical protein